MDVFVRNLATGVTTLVSINADGTAAGNNSSGSPVISADGHFVAFRSEATDLVSTPTGGVSNIFLRDLVAGTTTLVSVNSSGNDGGNDTSEQPDISDDGSRIVFQSVATDLVSTPTTTRNVFLRDVVAGTTTLISVSSSDSGEGNNISVQPSISGDGTHVAFLSFATDLIADVADTNNASDVFVHTVGGSTRLVSINSGHTAAGNGSSDSPVLSADGKLVAFRSDASNLVSGDTNGKSDIFVRDRSAGKTTLVSVNVNAAGTRSGDRDSDLPVISGNGQVVAFRSLATNLVKDISLTDKRANIYARDLAASTTVLASINPAGTAGGNRDSQRPDVSSNGRVVSFDSDASNLLAGDANQTIDVFARNLVANNGQAANTTEAVSRKAAGLFTGDRGADQPALSSSGQFVAFSSDAIGLTTDDTDGHVNDVFLRDVVAGTTVLVSINSDDTSDEPSISSDGNRIAFRSFTRNLAAPDSNTSGDIFVRDRSAGTTTLVSINAAGTNGGDADSELPVISGNGEVVAFRSLATNLVTGISGLDSTFTDIYARNLVTGETNLLSVNAAGNASGNGGSNAPRLSADGKTATFGSSATNLIGAGITDGNATEDVFANRRIGLSIDGLSQREGDSGTTAYNFTVTLSAPSMQTVTVHFATADGTATTANNDYQATSGDLTFNPGDTSKTVTVQVNSDTTPEPDETFFVNLSNPSNATLAQSTGTGTILNDDAASTTTAATNASATFNVSNQTVTLTGSVTSAGGPVNGGTFTFAVAGLGSATSGTVSNSTATATFTIPGGTAAASYAITTAYSGSTNFATSSNNTGSLTVNQAPAITSPNRTVFIERESHPFTVRTSGFPNPTLLIQSGDLPAGVTFTDNHDGTATLGGLPEPRTSGTYPLTLTADNGVDPDATQTFTLTMVESPQVPTIASDDHATFTVGSAESFTVETTGAPTPTITASGTLADGVTFHDNGDGTATLAGTPDPDTGGTYTFTITAANGVDPDATQTFTLTVAEAPSITSEDHATFTVGTAGKFTVTTAHAFPAPASISEAGTRPTGVTFTDRGDGTAVLAG